MGEEKSAGIVLFRNISNKNEFLLLNYPGALGLYKRKS